MNNGPVVGGLNAPIEERIRKNLSKTCEFQVSNGPGKSRESIWTRPSAAIAEKR